MPKKVGILHPGQMGVSVAATVKNSGNEVYWVSEGRSGATRDRAEAQGLVEISTLRNLCGICEVIISVCPPHAAEDIARSVVACGYDGIYLDANAISPKRVTRMADLFRENRVEFVDGSIIGGPAWQPGRTWLFLSGTRSEGVAPLFSAGPLECECIGPEVGRASALKMCFAAYTKGSTALLGAILAAAEGMGVRGGLEKQWSRDGSDFAAQTLERVRRVTAKAWRFEGEMAEIADTFENANIPGGFHRAAQEIYHRLAHFKDHTELPPLEVVLQALLEGKYLE
jgi:3-hydroxyisobutyrate dehydrogenase-like beta-hydroxyacid dehydrogenase